MIAIAKKAVAITVGEPAGIGADLILQLIQTPQPILPVIFADIRLLQARAATLGLSCQFKPWMGRAESLALGEAYVVNIPQAGTLTAQILDVANAPQIVAALTQAATACLRGELSALITGPVHKANINDAGIAFTGQTEWIAHCCEIAEPVMMLASETLRVALVTTHMALAKVPSAITRERLMYVVKTVAHDLTRFFHITQPRLAVCGLNPHAGEQGYLGTEEQTIINPCLATLRAEGFDVSDAISADTLFVPDIAASYDALIAMYHDQGLPVIKAQSFGAVVNMTLGLPICRLSVDHGTALSLAGTGMAKLDSLQTAVNLAAKFIG